METSSSFCLAQQSLSSASFHWCTHEQQRGTVSSNSRIQTVQFQHYSANLSKHLVYRNGSRTGEAAAAKLRAALEGFAAWPGHEVEAGEEVKACQVMAGPLTASLRSAADLRTQSFRHRWSRNPRHAEAHAMHSAHRARRARARRRDASRAALRQLPAYAAVRSELH